ncbi:carbamoyl-phosphate synthase (glutamine-hydrolyzing) large subunit [candidate division KSB1 bacterium]|nr:carbamoyl-phosphate synthase (glutamine-hydrolyzing) large subunit [candidate division KSB1 bacterium]RQW09804.1 MAG: carbamoyl-phosphate synthase (glutamine-hydrolyzing) large subunit [candidate division KSB1 bacterium]
MSLPNKVIILGSSALKIGEAGEFDYSGSQAIKALKEEGVFTILVNPNIATIQTSDHLADQVYFLPVTPYFVEQVIQKEKPDGILLGFGGQTALNCGLELERSGVLARYGVRVLGTPVEAILNTEDRELFVARLQQINVKTPRSFAVKSTDEAVTKARDIGFPVMIRIAFALGGLGSGLCRDETEVHELAQKAFSYTNQILVEEYLLGWKEIEYEIVRDQYDNCLAVCNMENFDPMGIHTGESIVVAPSQTLTNREYHMLRAVAIRTVRHLGIVGECNIQYALDPFSEDYRVIEINARLSRSSALASKATGYPLAHVAAKLALGHSLTEVSNSITKVTKASFEPALDYLVVKMPRWDLQKFRQVSKKIGSGMKSVGEIMAIGRTFEEALQKGLRMLEIGASGLVLNRHFDVKDIKKELAEPTDQRIFAIPAAFKAGMTVDDVHGLTYIDKWFLYKIKNIVDIEERLGAVGEQRCPHDLLQEAKQHGFSDAQIGRALGATESDVRQLRRAYSLTPKVKQIDTLAAEYPAQTNYLYLTYNGAEDDPGFLERNSVMVLGGGAYRIGSSVEFDWCCVNSVMTLKDLNYQTIMVNCNPETVSTDYDECDKLYFDELSFETVLDIYEKEKPIGVIVSMGGQIPNNLALRLDEAGVKLLGTSARSIDNAEDRHKFSKMLDDLGIDQPEWRELAAMDEAIRFAEAVGYPVLVRPSYVLSGAAMSVASTNAELIKFLNKASDISSDHPVVISKFIEHAKEIEIDAVAQEGELLVYAISEHVENAGVHSGDATMVLPPQRTYLETTRRVKKIARQLAKILKINGPFNMQFVARDNDVKVIELNLRASRSFPFASKIFKMNFIDIATRVIMGHHVPKIDRSAFDLEYVGVKAPQFSFTRLIGADPTLGVEMASTGEVGCLGDDFDEAFLKALLSVGYKLPIRNILLSTGPIESKAEFLPSTRLLQSMGMNFYATGGTASFMQTNGISVTKLHWPLSEKKPNVSDYLEAGKIDLVINIPKNYQEEELTNDYMIRRKAVDFAIPLFTNLQLARRFVEAISRKSLKDLQIKSWKEHV